jgi:hypothetical protein
LDIKVKARLGEQWLPHLNENLKTPRALWMKVEIVFNSFYQKSNFKKLFFSKTNIIFLFLLIICPGRVEAALQVWYKEFCFSGNHEFL